MSITHKLFIMVKSIIMLIDFKLNNTVQAESVVVGKLHIRWKLLKMKLQLKTCIQPNVIWCGVNMVKVLCESYDWWLSFEYA